MGCSVVWFDTCNKSNNFRYASFCMNAMAKFIKTRTRPGLLAYRIWTIERRVSAVRATMDGTLMPIVRIFVDAAIMYSTVLFVMLVCFLCSNNAQYVILDTVIIIPNSRYYILLNFCKIIPIIPIAFYMVFIRITLRNNTLNHLWIACGAGSDGMERDLRRYPAQPLQNHKSQWAHTDNFSHGVGNEAFRAKH
jgi:hypothetical protein